MLSNDSCAQRPGEVVVSNQPVDERDDDLETLGPIRTFWERIVTPGVVLTVFTGINFITYYDRGAISGCLASIKDDKKISGGVAVISDTHTGLLISGFMIGFMTASPIFAALGGTIQSKWMIMGGMAVWALACVCTGIANSYPFLLVSRIVVGVGEAAFTGFTVTTIDRIAPPGSRTLWIGIFYSMIPVGTAVGITLGGIISSLGMLGSIEAWRFVFFTEVIASVPIVLPVAFFPARYNMRTTSDGSLYFPIHKATWLLAKNIKYVLLVIGYAMYCFVVGAVAVWGIPMLIQGPMHVSYVNASAIMGGVTALAGVLGSLLGGIAFDKMKGPTESASMVKGQLFISLLVFSSVPLGIVALYMKNIVLFILFFTLSVFTLFMVTAPVNAAIMNIVPHELKAYAISYSVFFIHALGDFPSPTITGLFSDHVFSKGCPLHNATACAVDTANSCYWVNSTTTGSEGHCVNEYQLRNALLVIFVTLSVAVPCWLVVACLVGRSRRHGPALTESSDVSLVRREESGGSSSGGERGDDSELYSVKPDEKGSTTTEKRNSKKN